jgi:pyroglutamyl-peptidase
MNILLTGFGPFPGAPFNPTARLVERLARSRHLARSGVQRTAHVFRTSYDSVDRELPALLARTKPDVWVMFGLAGRTRHVRIETRARNAISRVVPDTTGRRSKTGTIVAGAAATKPMRAPAQRLVKAARSTGVKAALSHDAGRYLCNYLCWRAAEAAGRPHGPKVAAFVHVPKVRAARGARRAPLTFDRLLRAGEAIVLAAIAGARTPR